MDRDERMEEAPSSTARAKYAFECWGASAGPVLQNTGASKTIYVLKHNVHHLNFAACILTEYSA